MKKLLLSVALATMTMGYGQTYFSDNFDDEDIADWTRYDEDGDGIQWGDIFEVTNSSGVPVTPVSLISRSWQGAPLTPDNWVVSPAIDLSNATGQVTLQWKVMAAAATWDNEKYSVYVSTSSDLASLEASTVTFTEIYDDPANAGTQYTRNLDLSSFVGQTVYIAFRHHDVTDMDFLSIDDVQVKAPATSAPNCPSLSSPANAATGINYQAPVALSWAAPAAGSPVDSYDVYLDTNADPTTMIGNTTSTTINATGLSGGMTYYWKVVSKNTAGAATGCMVYSFTTSAPTYCGPLAFTTDVEPITLVNFAGINNVTDPTIDGTPAHEDFSNIVGTVAQGSSHAITLKGNTGGNYTNRFAVFIDWNQDMDFADAGETYQITQTIVNSTGVDAVQAVQTLAVPADALAGNTKMRVKKIFGTTNYLNPCLGASFGQAEDYTINVTTLAVSDVAKNALKVYPNPVVDVMNVEAASKVKSVSVYDATGKMVSSHVLNAAKSQVNLSQLTPGSYVVTIQTENGTQSVKIIKK